MKAVILAGGLGTRLRGVLGDLPKPMAPIGGKPFLEYLVRQLCRLGIRDIIFATGYKGEAIASHFAGGAAWGARISYSAEKTPLGTGGAVREAMGTSESDRYLVLNGDSFFDLDFASLLDFHHRKNALASIALRQLPDTGRYGRVEISPDGDITSFREKEAGGAGLINSGVYLFERGILSRFPAGPFSLEGEVLPKLIGNGLYGMIQQGFFIDIGIPEDYFRISVDFGALSCAEGSDLSR